MPYPVPTQADLSPIEQLDVLKGRTGSKADEVIAKLAEAMKHIEEPEHLIHLGQIGKAKESWYKAFGEMAVHLFGQDEAKRGGALLAAVSANKSEEASIMMALRCWHEWKQLHKTYPGYGYTPKEIRKVLQGKIHGSGVDEAEASKVLAAPEDKLEDLNLLGIYGYEGARKINSFNAGIQHGIKEYLVDSGKAPKEVLDTPISRAQKLMVTIDRHSGALMTKAGDQPKITDPYGYTSKTLAHRHVANLLGISPHEAQAEPWMAIVEAMASYAHERKGRADRPDTKRVVANLTKGHMDLASHAPYLLAYGPSESLKRAQEFLHKHSKSFALGAESNIINSANRAAISMGTNEAPAVHTSEQLDALQHELQKRMQGLGAAGAGKPQSFEMPELRNQLYRARKSGWVHKYAAAESGEGDERRMRILRELVDMLHPHDVQPMISARPPEDDPDYRNFVPSARGWVARVGPRIVKLSIGRSGSHDPQHQEAIPNLHHAHLSFGWADPRVQEQGLEFQPHESLQKGSLAFLRRLQSVAKRAHEMGVPIGYEADEQHARLYNKLLGNLGFTKDMGENTEREKDTAKAMSLPFYRWRPPKVSFQKKYAKEIQAPPLEAGAVPETPESEYEHHFPGLHNSVKEILQGLNPDKLFPINEGWQASVGPRFVNARYRMSRPTVPAFGEEYKKPKPVTYVTFGWRNSQHDPAASFNDLAKWEAQDIAQGRFGHRLPLGAAYEPKQQLQTGGLDFLKMLREVAKHASTKGISIEFMADPQHARLYKKLLGPLGFTQSRGPDPEDADIGGSATYEWDPPQVQKASKRGTKLKYAQPHQPPGFRIAPVHEDPDLVERVRSFKIKRLLKSLQPDTLEQWGSRSSDRGGGYTATIGPRYIEGSVHHMRMGPDDSMRPRVYVAFGWNPGQHREGGEFSPKSKLEEGSLEFLRHLQTIAKAAQEQGIPISFRADKHHAKLYDKMLTRMGLNKVHGPSELFHNLMPHQQEWFAYHPEQVKFAKARKPQNILKFPAPGNPLVSVPEVAPGQNINEVTGVDEPPQGFSSWDSYWDFRYHELGRIMQEEGREPMLAEHKKIQRAKALQEENERQFGPSVGNEHLEGPISKPRRNKPSVKTKSPPVAKVLPFPQKYARKRREDGSLEPLPAQLGHTNYGLQDLAGQTLPPITKPRKYAKQAIREDGSTAPMGTEEPLVGQGAATGGHPAPDGGAMIGVSPSTEDSMPHEKAFKNMSSNNFKAFKKKVDSLRKQIGLQGTTQEALGDWVDGAEESLMQTLTHSQNPEQIRYLAAWYGLMGNQKAVLVFNPHYQGPDSTYQLDVPETNLGTIRKSLDAAGIPYRTLVPKKDHTQVVVFDKGRELRQNISHFASQYNARINEYLGTGEFLGSSTRAEARHKYRGIIQSYESKAANDYPDRGTSPPGSARPAPSVSGAAPHKFSKTHP